MMKLLGAIALVSLGWFGRDLVHVAYANNTVTVQTTDKVPAIPSVDSVKSMVAAHTPKVEFKHSN